MMNTKLNDLSKYDLTNHSERELLLVVENDEYVYTTVYKYTELGMSTRDVLEVIEQMGYKFTREQELYFVNHFSVEV